MDLLEQRFPTCGTRTPQAERCSVRWYAYPKQSSLTGGGTCVPPSRGPQSVVCVPQQKVLTEWYGIPQAEGSHQWVHAYSQSRRFNRHGVENSS
ncbi:hypothetical protein AVEN_207728-1 [Araneus ventricosus]|uniref:Uncharacterized protein n=1 Tax=Araneus ventricosus TaxID=182803 RepID=A0A4Y2T5S5_ARAVE|nr:hypothetical protein AVEN_207728-1 [Araneus ventricosus]